jgi:carboxyl-terminal processing protease
MSGAVRWLIRIAQLACVLLPLSVAHGAPGQSLEPSAGEKRLALVIGNGSYRTSPLKNPVNDAHAMATSLRSLGFEVLLKEDAGLDAMIDALRDFSRRAQDAQVRLFYYAGHGVQVRGRNYLVPVDADIKNEDEVPSRSADVNDLLDRLGQMKNGLNIVILDACRNNPFTGNPVLTADGRVVRSRSLGAQRQGLAQVDAPQGTLVAFATAPGSIAMDGANYRNSLYTKHLLDHIGDPGVPVEQMFKRVRMAVAQETNRQQVPWESSSLMGDFCFRSEPGRPCAGMDLKALQLPSR